MKHQRTLKYVIGALLLLVFAGFSFSEFKNSLTPYVPYDVARESQRPVQVAGGLLPASSSYDTDTGLLHFTLIDEEDRSTMPVRYSGLKPANFEEAISIVAIGHYDEATSEFAANKLLVKCPSKYQGIEGEEKSYGDPSTDGYDAYETGQDDTSKSYG